MDNPHFVDDNRSQNPYYADMTADEFCEWLNAMKISAAEAARLLDVNVNTITRYKRDGGPRILRLACAYLRHNDRAMARHRASQAATNERLQKRAELRSKLRSEGASDAEIAAALNRAPYAAPRR